MKKEKEIKKLIVELYCSPVFKEMNQNEKEEVIKVKKELGANKDYYNISKIVAKLAFTEDAPTKWVEKSFKIRSILYDLGEAYWDKNTKEKPKKIKIKATPSAFNALLKVCNEEKTNLGVGCSALCGSIDKDEKDKAREEFWKTIELYTSLIVRKTRLETYTSMVDNLSQDDYGFEGVTEELEGVEEQIGDVKTKIGELYDKKN